MAKTEGGRAGPDPRLLAFCKQPLLHPGKDVNRLLYNGPKTFDNSGDKRALNHRNLVKFGYILKKPALKNPNKKDKIFL